MAAAIPGGERVISAEEVFELRFPHPDWVAMQTRQSGLEGTGEIRLRDLVKESLRMRPSRIIVGEVRAEECLDLLLALNAGVPGMCTLHANFAREALVKMCTLPLLAGENVSGRFVVPTVAASVDLVVHLGIDPQGRRRVNEIVGVPGRVENDVIEIEPSSSARAASYDARPACRRVRDTTSGSVSTCTRSSTGSADGRPGRSRRRGGAAPGVVGVRRAASGSACTPGTTSYGGAPRRCGTEPRVGAGVRRGLPGVRSVRDAAHAGRDQDPAGGAPVRCDGSVPPGDAGLGATAPTAA